MVYTYRKMKFVRCTFMMLIFFLIEVYVRIICICCYLELRIRIARSIQSTALLKGAKMHRSTNSITPATGLLTGNRNQRRLNKLRPDESGEVDIG